MEHNAANAATEEDSFGTTLAILHGVRLKMPELEGQQEVDHREDEDLTAIIKTRYSRHYY